MTRPLYGRPSLAAPSLASRDLRFPCCPVPRIQRSPVSLAAPSWHPEICGFPGRPFPRTQGFSGFPGGILRLTRTMPPFTQLDKTPPKWGQAFLNNGLLRAPVLASQFGSGQSIRLPFGATPDGERFRPRRSPRRTGRDVGAGRTVMLLRITLLE